MNLIKPYERKALYYETDQMAIIHHSNYVRWLEEARIDLMEQMGISYRNMEDVGILIPVLAVACEYKHPVRFDETVLIETAITRFNGIKFDASYRIIGKENGQLKLTGSSKHCFVNRNMVPIRLKKDFPEIYDKFQQVIKELTE